MIFALVIIVSGFLIGISAYKTVSHGKSKIYLFLVPLSFVLLFVPFLQVIGAGISIFMVVAGFKLLKESERQDVQSPIPTLLVLSSGTPAFLFMGYVALRVYKTWALN